MPQFRHPAVKERVRTLAQKHNLPFHTMSYWGAIKTTFANLDKVSRELSHEQ